MGLCLGAVQRLAHGLDAQDGFVIAAAGVVFYDAGDQDHLLVLEVEHDQVVDEKELHGVRVAGSQRERWFGVLNEIVREIAGDSAVEEKLASNWSFYSYQSVIICAGITRASFQRRNSAKPEAIKSIGKKQKK